MTFEEYLCNKLSRFTLIEYSLVILVYFTISLLCGSLYIVLQEINWWFYLVFVIFCTFPLIVRLVSQPGNGIRTKINSCLKNNTPSLQMLLFVSTFFFAQLLVLFFPVLAQGSWQMYLILIIVLAIQPLRKSWIW